MILQPLAKQDFEFKRDVRVDVENKGFSEEEMKELVPAQAAAGMKGSKGDFWKDLWSPNRKVPPALKNLASEFGYQSMPVLTDLVKVAEAQATPLEANIKAKIDNYNFYIMR